MTMSKTEAIEAVKMIQDLGREIVQMAREEKDGIPSGVLYAAMMPYGVSYTGYTTLITMLRETGMITVSGNVIRAGKES